MPVEAHRRAIRTLGRIFFKAYGLSETGIISCLVPEEQIIEGPPETVNKLTSCGREVANVEVRVVDDDGRDVAPGQVGEVIVRGDNLMTGYWKMPQATEEALKGGYMHTGDLGTMDEDGYLYLAGRKKDLIVSGGQTIYAAEVEEVIGRHPGVAEAAVIGVPDETSGQSIKAVVVVRKGTNVTAEDILEFCQQSLPVHAYPRSVVFVERLPRSPTGKVLKRVLEERYH
jgi:acyl-CoA synthetase (AMP-forming)/AMP-acid ligase II